MVSVMRRRSEEAHLEDSGRSTAVDELGLFCSGKLLLLLRASVTRV